MFHAPPEPENAKAPRWQSRGFAETNENQFRPPSDRPPAGRNQGVRIEEDDNPPVMQGRLGACRDPRAARYGNRVPLSQFLMGGYAGRGAEQ
jgi:hypothetical protein